MPAIPALSSSRSPGRAGVEPEHRQRPPLLAGVDRDRRTRAGAGTRSSPRRPRRGSPSNVETPWWLRRVTVRRVWPGIETVDLAVTHVVVRPRQRVDRRVPDDVVGLDRFGVEDLLDLGVEAVVVPAEPPVHQPRFAQVRPHGRERNGDVDRHDLTELQRHRCSPCPPRTTLVREGRARSSARRPVGTRAEPGRRRDYRRACRPRHRRQHPREAHVRAGTDHESAAERPWRHRARRGRDGRRRDLRPAGPGRRGRRLRRVDLVPARRRDVDGARATRW